MTLKVIYFTAGSTPTPEELAEIATLNDLAVPPLSVNVSNGSVPPGLGLRPPEGEEEGPQQRIEAADLVWGAVPDAYSDYEVFDPDNPPAPPLPESKAVVADGNVITIGEETFTFTVAGGEITAIVVGEA